MQTIPSHTCTKAELGLEGDGRIFMPLKAKDKHFVSLYSKKFLCVDPQDMYINGSYDSSQARMLVL